MTNKKYAKSERQSTSEERAYKSMRTAMTRAATTTKKGASGSCLDKRTCFHLLRCIDNREEEERGSFESFRLFEVIYRQLMRSMCLPFGLDREASFECKQDALACTLPCVSEIESCIGGEIFFLLSLVNLFSVKA